MLVTADQKTKPLIKTLAADGDVICWQVNFQNYLGELLAKLGQTMGTVLLASIFRVNGKVLHITKITVIPIENQAKKGVVFPNPNAIEVGAGCHSLSMIFLQSKLHRLGNFFDIAPRFVASLDDRDFGSVEMS